MRSFLGNNCAKGCFIYLFALVLIVVVSSIGLSGLSARFGAAQVQGNNPSLPAAAGQAASAVQSGLDSVIQDGSDLGSGGGAPPTAVTAPQSTVAPSQASGQTLPQPTAIPPSPAQGQGGTITGEVSQPFYIVQPGDTLWAISRKFGVDIATLSAENNISGNIIYPGQVIYLSAPGQPISQALPLTGENPPVPNMPDTGITSRKP